MITSVLDVCWFLFVRRLSLCLLRCPSPLMCVSASVCEMLSRMWNAKCQECGQKEGSLQRHVEPNQKKSSVLAL